MDPSGRRGRRHLRAPRNWLAWAHGASLAVGAVILVRANRRQWFFGDEWAVIMAVASHRPDLLAPHNEHWITLLRLEYWALLEMFGVRSYIPFVVVMVAGHLVAAHLLWRLMLRVGVNPLLSMLLAAVFVILGVGAENLLWALQIQFIAALAFGIGGVLMLDRVEVNRRRDVAAVALALASLICSGVGVTMVGVMILTAWLRRGWRAALEVGAVPAVVFAIWFLTEGRSEVGQQTSIDETTLLNIPQFMWTGLTSTFERASGIAGAGAVLVLALLVFLLRRTPAARGTAAPVVAMAIGAVFWYCFVGVGRTGFGVGEAVASRYSYIAIALLLPAIGLALTWLVEATSIPVAAAVGIAVLLGVQNASLLRTESGAEAAREISIKGQVLAAASLMKNGEPLLRDRAEPVFDPDIDTARLQLLANAGWLPPLQYDETDLLNARVNLQTAVSVQPGAPPPPPSTTIVDSARLSTGPVDASGCTVAHPTGASPQIVLDARSPLTVTIQKPGGGAITVYLRDPEQPTVISQGASFPLAATDPTTLQIATRDSEAIVTLPEDGDSTVCGLHG